MSRHRGAKLRRQCELSSAISLLSPAQLLFVERQPFHDVLPDHYTLLTYLLDLSVLQLSLLLLLHFCRSFITYWLLSNLSKPLDFYDILLQNSVPEKLPGNNCSYFGQYSPMFSQGLSLLSMHSKLIGITATTLFLLLTIDVYNYCLQ